MMRRPSRPIARLAKHRAIILLGPDTAEENLRLDRAARRLDLRLRGSARSLVVPLDLLHHPLDCAPLHQRLTHCAEDGADLVTIVPCFYPFSRSLRQAVQQAVATWEASTDRPLTCYIAGSFDQLLDLDLLIDLSLQMRVSSPTPDRQAQPTPITD